jgi:hypothetical protein
LANQWTYDSDDDDFDNDGQGQQQQGQGQQLPNAARQHMRKMEQENKKLKEKLDELERAQRKTSIADLVKAKGYDPEVVDLIPGTVEATDVAVTAWLDSKSKVLAKMKTESDDDGAQGGTGGGDGGPATVIDPEVAKALAMMGVVTSGAITPTKPADLMAQLNDPNLTLDQLNALVRSQGGKV